MLTRNEKIFTIVGTLLGMLLAALDQTIVATAGPAIQADLQILPSVYAWITTSYLVTSTMMIPIYGKLSDLYGRKNILVLGIVIFLLGSFLCGIAPSTVQLILYRGIQGMGSAALFTSAFAVVADIFPPAERGKYQGIFGSVFGLSSVAGPLAGGFITDHLGWHWVFFINLPIGAVALAFILAKMPALKRHFGEMRPSVDVPGALALMLAVVPLLLALSLGRSHAVPGEAGFEWVSWQILGLFGASIVGVALFLLAELKAKDPIIDLSLFRNRTFATGNAAAFVVGAAFLGAVVFLPLFMVNVVGLSATHSGLTITPLTLGVVAGNITSGQLVARLGRYKKLLLGSLVLLSVGFLIMGFTLSPDSTQGEVTLKMILVGIGLGPSIPLFTLAVQNAVQPQQMGVATSSVTFFRQLGSTVGVAILGTVFGSALSTHLADRMADATRDLPPAIRAQFAPDRGAQTPGVEGESAASKGFPAEEIKTRVHEGFEHQRDLVQRALGSNDHEALQALLSNPMLDARLKQALSSGPEAKPIIQSGLAQAEEKAMATVDQMHLAFKSAFTDAIEKIYRFTLLLALIGFAIVTFIPELPLRRTNQPMPIAE